MTNISHNLVLTQLTALQSMDVKQLRSKWLELYKRDSPKVGNCQYLRRRLAYRIQELAYGGDSEETIARLEAEANRLMQQQHPTHNKCRVAAPGSILTRAYNGIEHQVKVLADNYFEYEGCRYKSLSAIAKFITGTSWNGFLFFHLKQRASRKQCAL